MSSCSPVPLKPRDIVKWVLASETMGTQESFVTPKGIVGCLILILIQMLGNVQFNVTTCHEEVIEMDSISCSKDVT